ncbi:MAG: hypothetical protein ACOC44_12425, partial [Promethearchaeia archaeon]
RRLISMSNPAERPKWLTIALDYLRDFIHEVHLFDKESISIDDESEKEYAFLRDFETYAKEEMERDLCNYGEKGESEIRDIKITPIKQLLGDLNGFIITEYKNNYEPFYSMQIEGEIVRRIEERNQLKEIIYKWKEFNEEPRGEPEFSVFLDEVLEVMEGEGVE